MDSSAQDSALRVNSEGSECGVSVYEEIFETDFRAEREGRDGHIATRGNRGTKQRKAGSISDDLIQAAEDSSSPHNLSRGIVACGGQGKRHLTKLTIDQRLPSLYPIIATAPGAEKSRDRLVEVTSLEGDVLQVGVEEGLHLIQFSRQHLRRALHVHDNRLPLLSLGLRVLSNIRSPLRVVTFRRSFFVAGGEVVESPKGVLEAVGGEGSGRVLSRRHLVVEGIQRHGGRGVPLPLLHRHLSESLELGDPRLLAGLRMAFLFEVLR